RRPLPAFVPSWLGLLRACGALCLAASLSRCEQIFSGSSMPGLITPIGAGTALVYPKQVTAGAPLDPLAAPGNTNPPIIFEPPPALSGGAAEVWVIATGGSHWGGAQLWISTDGNTYAFAGNIYRSGPQGGLTAALPSHADPDT